MLRFTKPIPLSLYIHIPWCIQKCPYCDFNSHTHSGKLPEKIYIERLIHDLDQDLSLLDGRSIQTIFIGGGTPSLISPEAYHHLFNHLNLRLEISASAEISLEANPGTAEQSYFQGYRELGINRLSLGIQSLQDDKLKALGRIHNAEQAIKAVQTARDAGFDNINLDLMYGLPQQSLSDALYDLEKCMALQPDHLSWYHLTLEPNTLFHKFPPPLPEDELIWKIQEAGQKLLAQQGYQHYEISAYARENKECAHNLNYWQFGDYLGIGAGAHGKITDLKNGCVHRTTKFKNPKDYLDPNKPALNSSIQVPKEELALEFMMNNLRLYSSISLDLFTERTGLEASGIHKQLETATKIGLLNLENNCIKLSQQGHLFLNEVLELFIPF